MRRRNPQDSTRRNDRASLKRDQALAKRLTALRAEVTQLREQLAALFEAKAKPDFWIEPYPTRGDRQGVIIRYRVAGQ